MNALDRRTVVLWESLGQQIKREGRTRRILVSNTGVGQAIHEGCARAAHIGAVRDARPALFGAGVPVNVRRAVVCQGQHPLPWTAVVAREASAQSCLAAGSAVFGG